MGRTQPARSGFTLVELLVVMTIIAVLMGLLVGAVQQVRGLALNTTCKNNLSQFMIAMHQFDAAKGSLPGSKMALPGRFSIHTELLPYMDQAIISDSLIYEIEEPTIRNVTTDASGSQVMLPTNWTWGSFNQAQPVNNQNLPGSHFKAVNTPIASFQCPADTTINAITTGGNNYVPIVGTFGARQNNSGGPRLRGIWPPDNEVGFPLPVGQPEEKFRALVSPISLNVLSTQDGTTHTAGITERVKGVLVSGVISPKNMAVSGGTNSFYIIQGTEITTSNQDMVIGCKQAAMVVNNNVAVNNLSGVQWFQHTCRWLGCANMMGPPNTPPCTGTNTDGNLAWFGIAAPSSNHGDMANVVMMDRSVRSIPNDVDLKVMHAMGTWSGRELHPWQ
ncbi:Hypothetical protein PBC10988_24570 [Planctomycetales bacterium 10988]|nr:Hypothetical protein PBC10988_24570 [Planctomycetales bacterium 10988]